jgi:hypothetical protein
VPERCAEKETQLVAFLPTPPHHGSMAFDRESLQALKNIIEDVDLIPETSSDLPKNRTGRSRELLNAALKLTDHLLKNSCTNAAAILGRKGGSTAARKLCPEHMIPPYAVAI